jgi:hypothetical protein
MKITEKTFDILTGEETVIERDETALEATERLERSKEIAKEQAEIEAKATAREVVLTRLGLTVEEAALLLG